MKALLTLFIRVYQHVKMPVFALFQIPADTCRYEPTCSQYMIDAIEKYGVRKGIPLGIRRFISCNPRSTRPHFDPVL